MSAELPPEALTRARRAFPAAAPHALKAALEAAEPCISAAAYTRGMDDAFKEMRDLLEGWQRGRASVLADLYAREVSP